MNSSNSTATVQIRGRDVTVPLNRHLSTHKLISGEIRALAASQGLTDSMLAKCTGIKRRTLRKSLHGDRDWYITELYQVAIALNVQSSDLLRLAAREASAKEAFSVQESR